MRMTKIVYSKSRYCLPVPVEIYEPTFFQLHEDNFSELIPACGSLLITIAWISR